MLHERVDSAAELANPLGLIQNVANEMAKDLNEYQCQLTEVVRSPEMQKLLVRFGASSN